MGVSYDVRGGACDMRADIHVCAHAQRRTSARHKQQGVQAVLRNMRALADSKGNLLFQLLRGVPCNGAIRRRRACVILSAAARAHNLSRRKGLARHLAHGGDFRTRLFCDNSIKSDILRHGFGHRAQSSRICYRTKGLLCGTAPLRTVARRRNSLRVFKD